MILFNLQSIIIIKGKRDWCCRNRENRIGSPCSEEAQEDEEIGYQRYVKYFKFLNKYKIIYLNFMKIINIY